MRSCQGGGAASGRCGDLGGLAGRVGRAVAGERLQLLLQVRLPVETPVALAARLQAQPPAVQLADCQAAAGAVEGEAGDAQAFEVERCPAGRTLQTQGVQLQMAVVQAEGAGRTPLQVSAAQLQPAESQQRRAVGLLQLQVGEVDPGVVEAQVGSGIAPLQAVVAA